MDLGDVAYCTSLVDFSVEVIDDLYTVTTSGTYFTDNGTVVSGSLTTISGGYLMSYLTVPSGNMLLVANGSNNNNEFYSRTYELQYGYQASWEEVNYWGPKYEVPIAVSAKNTSLASNTSYFSTFFETRKIMSTDLEAFITAEGSGKADFTGYIEPRSKHFMYGKTYSITISGIQDYSGNILSPFTYTFTIEEEG
jgi:hypothetical protein